MDRQAVKPPFAYYGGKMTLGPQIASLLPEQQHSSAHPFRVNGVGRSADVELDADHDDSLLSGSAALRTLPTGDVTPRVCGATVPTVGEPTASFPAAAPVAGVEAAAGGVPAGLPPRLAGTPASTVPPAQRDSR